jgi:secreted trypsin-like serine protease
MLGYGITDEQKQDSLVLRTTKKSYKADSFVKESLIGFNQTNKTGGFCRGDSGAPIYVTSGGALKVIGVNSFNVGKEKNKECHTASFGMYTPYFKSWILSQSVEL